MSRVLKQRNGSDCAIAAVANAVGTAYAAVRRMWGSSVRGGLDDGDIDWLAGEFGGWHYTSVRKPYHIDRWLKRHSQGRYILVITCPWDSHAIAAVEGKILGEHNPDWLVRSYWQLLSLKNPSEIR